MARTEHPEFPMLLDKARSGDERAMHALIEPLRKDIYWRALKALGEPDEAEDVAQEVTLRIFTKLHTFQGDTFGGFRAWIARIVLNCVRMNLRARRRRRTDSIDDRLHDSEQAVDGAAVMGRGSRPFSPDEMAVGTELANRVEGAISRLPPQYGSILRLWVEEGLDLKQIRDRSGLSVPAVKSRLHRARKQVRSLMEAEALEPLAA